MESNTATSFFTELLSSLKPHILPISIACIGLILLGYGVISSFVPNSHSSDISFEADTPSVKKTSSTDTKEGNIVVDVSGAVQKPGVYRLVDNARVEDALVAAGGFSKDADLDWTQHSLNLAAKVTDGMKIYIPKLGESTTPLRQGFAGQAGGAVAGVSTNGLVSINTGSSSELEDLPGIGPVSAGKIIDNRPYGSVDELLSKKVVGKSVFEKIKDLVSL